MGCDIGVNFFVDESHVGHNMLDAILPALSALNSLCRIEVEKNSIENLADDFFLQFDLISYCGFDEVCGAILFVVYQSIE